MVGTGTAAGRGIVGYSRWVSWRHDVPPPEQGLEDYLGALKTAIAERSYSVVLPAGDADLLALSLLRDELPAAVPYGAHSGVLRSLDKLELVRAASGVGIPVPATVEAGNVEIDRWSYPALVKSRLHAPLARAGGPSRLEARAVASPEEASRRADEIRDAGGAPLLQERLAGRLMACTAVVDRDGRIVARVGQVAERTWPSGIGISSRARTIDVRERIWDRIGALLDELGWLGLAEVQLIAPDDGDPLLIDLNGRFYGSLALAVGAGVNLPAIWASVALGDHPGPATPAQLGVRYQWLEGDLRRAMSERRGGLMGDLTESLRYARGAVHSVWRRDDPRPALRYATAAAKRYVRAAPRKLAQAAQAPSSSRPSGTPSR
jgi:predicted ATP-grasp superfamily ATP-dependent carboligase